MKITSFVLVVLFASHGLCDDVRVQYRIQRTHNGIAFNDALYFTESEYANLQKDEAQSMADGRFDAWVQTIENPPVPPEPSKEDLERQQKEIEDYKAELERQILELEQKIAEKGGRG